MNIVVLDTVHVEPVADYPALKMMWQHHVTDTDVAHAFRQITVALENSDKPLYIVVDILSSPNFPLVTTTREALAGPYRNPKLQEWLIVGSNSMARVVERMLIGITSRSNVLWFDSEDEALDYLAKVTR